MIRAGRFFLIAGALGAIFAGVHLLPEAMGKLDFFQVDRIELEGARYLEHDEAVALAALPEGFSVWHDREPIAARLAAHPLVESVEVRRRMPSTLRLVVTEREPVALYPDPGLIPMDREGRGLPIDPVHHRLDLPLVRVAHVVETESGDTGVRPREVDRALLAREVARLGEIEPEMAASLSEASIDAHGVVTLHLANPRVEFRYLPPLSTVRIGEGIRVLTDAMERDPDRIPVVVDLRFADQVVVRLSPRPSR